MSNAPLLGKQFEAGEDVIFDGVAEVCGFTPDGVQVRFHGVTINVLPHELRKAQVGPLMKSVLRVFCGYIDVWFLRETFVTNWAPDKEMIEHRIEDETKTIFHELGMGEGWTKTHPLVSCTFGLYLRFILSPSVYIFQKHMNAAFASVGAVLLLMMLYTCYGFANFRSGDSDEQANARGKEAFGAVEHAPVTPVVLLLCTHLIFMIFATEQLKSLSGSNRISFPLTYPVMMGKTFMILRMLMAYSSANLGLSIDYFVWQELILISMHASLAVFVGDPSQSRKNTPGDSSTGISHQPVHQLQGIPYIKQLARACAVVFGIDFLKTFVMFVFWYNFKTGPLAYYVNRLPNIKFMLVASVLIHALLDLVQSVLTVFTMFIGKIFVALTTDQTLVGKQIEDHVETPGEQIARKLVGRWLTQSHHQVTIEAKYWNVQVPEGLAADNKFEFPTVYMLGVPRARMEIKVPRVLPKDMQLRVMELRVTSQFYGTHSVDASTLGPNNLHCLLPPHYARYYSRGSFDNDSTVKLDGHPHYGQKTYKLSRIHRARSLT